MKVHGLNRFCLAAYVAAFAFLLFISACSDDEESLVNDVSVKSISPESPAVLDYWKTSPTNDRVLIEYDYNITYEGGARIWVQPVTNGGISPGYVYSPSNVYTGKGSRTVVISVSGDEGEVTVDQLLVVIKDPDQNTTIREKYIDVDYTFR